MIFEPLRQMIKSKKLSDDFNILKTQTKLNPKNGLNWKKLSELLPGIDDAAAKIAVAHANELLLA